MTNHASDDDPRWLQTMTAVPFFVGIVANEWAKLEYGMVPIAEHLLKTSRENAKIIMFSMNPPQRRDFLLALAKENADSEEVYKLIKEYTDEFDALRQDRNNIVHGHWAAIIENGEPILHLVKSRQALKETSEQKELKWIISVARRIQHLSGKTSDIILQLRGGAT